MDTGGDDGTVGAVGADKRSILPLRLARAFAMRCVVRDTIQTHVAGCRNLLFLRSLKSTTQRETPGHECMSFMRARQQASMPARKNDNRVQK
jgi:hypothetical protein